MTGPILRGRGAEEAGVGCGLPGDLEHLFSVRVPDGEEHVGEVIQQITDGVGVSAVVPVRLMVGQHADDPLARLGRIDVVIARLAQIVTKRLVIKLEWPSSAWCTQVRGTVLEHVGDSQVRGQLVTAGYGADLIVSEPGSAALSNGS